MKMFNTRGALLTSNEGNLRSYDTGWIACSAWTNQHLGTALGGNVVHNLNTPLRNLMVKVFISTDGTDNNSLEVRWGDWSSAATVQSGLTIFQVDDDNITVQTGLSGLYYVIDADGSISVLNTESWYYRIVVYEMTSVYSGVAMEMYETPWINRSDWTNVHLGSTITKDTDSNLVHNLNAPLSDLMVKVLISTDGTDANSFELVDTGFDTAISANTTVGLSILAVDNDNVRVQTAIQGFLRIKDDGTRETVGSSDYYYKIVVYKLK